MEQNIYGNKQNANLQTQRDFRIEEVIEMPEKQKDSEKKAKWQIYHKFMKKFDV